MHEKGQILNSRQWGRLFTHTPHEGMAVCLPEPKCQCCHMTYCLFAACHMTFFSYIRVNTYVSARFLIWKPMVSLSRPTNWLTTAFFRYSGHKLTLTALTKIDDVLGRSVPLWHPCRNSDMMSIRRFLLLCDAPLIKELIWCQCHISQYYPNIKFRTKGSSNTTQAYIALCVKNYE